MSFGVMGGDYQPMGHLCVAVNRYVYGMDPQEAIDLPRYFPKGGEVLVESGVPEAAQAGLRDRGHALVPAPEPLGGGQAIVIDHRTRHAHRRLGPAQGWPGARHLNNDVKKRFSLLN